MNESPPEAVSRDLPEIPPELRAWPRRVKLKPLSSSMGLWVLRLFILPHSLIGITMAGAAIGYPIWVLAGTNHAAKVTATRYYTSSSKGHTTQHYEITYAYALDGVTRQKSADVSAAVFNRVGGVGGIVKPAKKVEAPAYGTVNVRGLGWPPLYYDAVVEPGTSLWAPWGFILLFAAFWNGILSLFWWLAYVNPWRIRRLYRTGRVGYGIITGKHCRIGSKGVRHNYLTYEFQTAEGLADRGEMLVANRAEYEAAAVDEGVLVLHPTGKTKPSVLYKYGLYRCV